MAPSGLEHPHNFHTCRLGHVHILSSGPIFFLFFRRPVHLLSPPSHSSLSRSGNPLRFFIFTPGAIPAALLSNRDLRLVLTVHSFVCLRFDRKILFIFIYPTCLALFKGSLVLTTTTNTRGAHPSHAARFASQSLPCRLHKAFCTFWLTREWQNSILLIYPSTNFPFALKLKRTVTHPAHYSPGVSNERKPAVPNQPFIPMI